MSAGCKEGQLNAAIGETVSVLALLGVLAWAVIRPRGWPEAVAAAPAAVILIAAGAIPAGDAGTEARRLGPVIGFLIAILVLARLCDDDGLFRACGAWLARSSVGCSSGRTRPRTSAPCRRRHITLTSAGSEPGNPDRQSDCL